MPDKRWIPETLFDDLGFRMTYRVDRVLYEMQTEHQHLILFEHPFFGKMLSLDGATGQFAWQPAPAFMGSYELLFLRTSCEGTRERIPVRVTISTQ